MPTDEYLLERINNITARHTANWTTKKMFGGVCYMVDDKMCFGTYKGGFMVRVGPENVAALLKRDGAEQMTNGGKVMKGYLWIDPSGYDTDNDLEFWIKKCLEFDPEVKVSSKKRVKK